MKNRWGKEIRNTINLLIVVIMIFVMQGCNNGDMAEDIESEASITHKDGFVLTYADEFDGDVLDTSFWYPGLPYDWNTSSLNDESQSYTSENIIVNDGIMSMVLEKRQVMGLKNGEEKSYEYASGCVNTSGKVSQKYGIWEIRAKMPSVMGAWPAFWLMPENGNIFSPVGAEIDVFENLAVWGDEIQFGMHYDGYGEFHQHFAAPKVTVPNISSEYHVYALEWHPDYIRLYVDGSEVAEYTGRAIPTSEHYAIINAAIGGWGGEIDDSGLNDSMDVDYIRIYQYEDYESIVESEAVKLSNLKTEPNGMDFEQHQIEGIVKNAGIKFDQNLVSLTDSVDETVSGDVSYKMDTTGMSDGNHIVYASPLGVMNAFDTYTISFDYKVLEKGKDDMFYYYIGSAADSSVQEGYKEFDPGTGASSGAGIVNNLSVNMNISDIADAVFVFGVTNQAAMTLDNLVISRYTPPSSGLDFEDISIEDIIDNAALGDSNDYGTEIMTLTQDKAEVISGNVSLKADATDTINTWNEIYQSPAGRMEANKSYNVTFNYKILEKNGNAFFYALGRSLSKAEGAPDLLGWTEWYDETGSQGEIRMVIDVPDYDDYYLIIGISRSGAIVIDNIVYEEIQ